MGVEIKVLKTLATEQAYRELLPAFEKASGHKVTTKFGSTIDVRNWLAADESFDLAMVASTVIDAFIASGVIAAGSRVDIATSDVGVAVRPGVAKPDISTEVSFKAALLAAKSVGYSTGPSGDHLIGLLNRIGLAERVTPKLKQIPAGGMVGTLVVNGEAEIGIQQVSELSTFPGVDYVGQLPGSFQKITIFASGISSSTKQPEATKALVAHLTAPEATSAFRKRGMEPA